MMTSLTTKQINPNYNLLKHYCTMKYGRELLIEILINVFYHLRHCQNVGRMFQILS